EEVGAADGGTVEADDQVFGANAGLIGGPARSDGRYSHAVLGRGNLDPHIARFEELDRGKGIADMTLDVGIRNPSVLPCGNEAGGADRCVSRVLAINIPTREDHAAAETVRPHFASGDDHGIHHPLSGYDEVAVADDNQVVPFMQRYSPSRYDNARADRTQ